MEDKYLYPIIGIALGWFLKELSTAFQSSQESKRRLGRAISSLAYLNQEMILIQGQFEVFKDLSDSHQEYERFRQYILRKYPRRDAAYVEQIKESISTVAELSPLTALNLEGIVNRYWFLQEAKLTETSKDYELYIYQLSSLEVGFELYQKEMEKILRKIAFMHGINTWAQVLYKSRKMRKNRPDKTESFNQILKQFKEAKEKYSQGDASQNKAASADAEN
ncbi:MAG: hypothetical protein PHI97_29205 [Desulfobulbus sp.]|nr:hypothetical protein [Desulfobulbus sp.]